MDLHFLHLYMEIAASACLFFIAWMNVRYNATGIYSNLMALGTSIAGVTDLTHAIVPMFYPDFAEHWFMMSWGASRITLILTFLMVYLCYDVLRCRLKSLALILATPLIFAVFMATSHIMGIGHFHLALHPIVMFGTVIHCPLDFMLLLLWLLTAILLRKKARILFPPYVYWLFMSQGIMVHAIMSFTSLNSLDLSSFLAHGLKISEYYSFILIYLLYKNSLDSLPENMRHDPSLLINKENNYAPPHGQLELPKRK